MLATTKILIHSDYGAYGEFSEEFQKTFAEKYDIDIYSITHYGPYFDKKNTNVGIETRYDPRIIDIFEQLGPEKSGGSSLNNARRALSTDEPTKSIDDRRSSTDFGVFPVAEGGRKLTNDVGRSPESFDN